MKKRIWIFHPLLLALYFSLFPVAQNLSFLEVSTVRPFLITFVAAIIFSLVVRKIVKDPMKAALLSSLFMIIFFSYGHVVNQLGIWFPSFNTTLSSLLILLIWGCILIIGSNFILRHLQDPSPFNSILNVIGAVLVFFPIYSIVTFRGYSNSSNLLVDQYLNEKWQMTGGAQLAQSINTSDKNTLPDIYFIILDGYSRQDVLRDYFAYDNQGFLDALRQRGFYVPELSQSNYESTAFSVASMLNMMQINDLPEYLSQSDASVHQGYANLASFADQLTEKNRVVNTLKQANYIVANYDSGIKETQIQAADLHLQSPRLSGNNIGDALELMFFDTTLGKFYRQMRGEEYQPFRQFFDDHRERILYQLETLPDFAKKDGNYFVFAHLIIPHNPYVFGPDGEARYSSDPFTLLDLDAGSQWDPSLYRDQVIFLNKSILAVIDEILGNSKTDPIIILQADHGNRSYDTLKMTDDMRYRMFFSIFSAYYFPNGATDELYDTITPVNIFRVVLNTNFGTDLDLLPDQQYVYSSGLNVDKFTPACEVLDCNLVHGYTHSAP